MLRFLALLVACLALNPFHPGSFANAQSSQEGDVIRQLRELRDAAESSIDAIARLGAVEKQIPEDAPYPLRRELMRTRMVVLEDSTNFEQRLAMVKSLHDLAEANSDTDTMNLMDVRRIYMSHAHDDIGKFIDQLNAVRARITPDASPEVMESLERSYGNLYFDAGNFDTALRHQLAALDWADRLPSGRESARLFRLGTIAELYNAMDLPEQALELVDRGFALGDVEELPTDNRISLYAARGMALLKLGRLPESEVALAEAERLSDTKPADFTAMRLATLRAEWTLAMAQPKQAIDVIDRLENLAKGKENAYFLAKALTLRGEAVMRLGRLDEGLTLMQKGIVYFKSNGQMADLLVSLDHQISTLRENRLFERAVTVMDERQALWTQLFRNERGRAIAEVEARHTSEALERRIKALSAENRAQEERLRAETLGKALAAALAALAITLSAVLVFAIRRARSERDSLSRVVRYDALTGALSRYQFQRRMDSGSATAKKPKTSTGLLLLDLDNFKSINDQFGHEAGDQVLKDIVERIRVAIGTADEVYRWGGEEFLVVLNGVGAARHEATIRNILERIEQSPVTWHGQSLPVSVSGGFVQHPLAADGKSPLSDAVRWSDAALYLAKNSGRRRVEEVRLTDAGRVALQGRRPIDMAQLLDWQRHGFVHVISHATTAPVPG